LDNADEWIGLCVNEGEPTRNFAIEVDGHLVGAIGLDLLDGEKTGVGNVGYWIAAAFWNRGIATEALRALIEYAVGAFSIRRLQASVFGWNPASGRVLEKCGFRLEGRFSNSIIKGGEVTDELVYGLVTNSTG
jgi:RimJ/RimL family protein N-acetyltransferase